MSSQLIINVTSKETRVAILENGSLVELHLERESERGIVGNIYKGKVQRVLPGMQAAFVDIGLEKAAFLYITDIYEDLTEYKDMTKDSEEEFLSEISPRAKCPLQIEGVLTEGQEILVQVAKDSIGTKGPRVTSYVTLPGRYLVYLPNFNYIAISRRIEDESERARLQKIVEKIKPSQGGFIIRTASEGAKQEDIEKDMQFLLKLWEKIQRKRVHSSAPTLVYQELNVTLRVIRDFYREDIDKIVVDSHEEYENIIEFMESFMPNYIPRVEYYEGLEPIFDVYGIEGEIKRALNKRVWLKSGGYIVIEETEALTTIDVNTGRFVGKTDPEETILRTNLEAVKEIAYQLRLRNIGGIIIVDFIDMKKDADRKKVLEALKEAVKADKVKTNILRMSELGLIEMTRKRTRESLKRQLCNVCPYCEERGCIRSISTVSYEVLRAIQREAFSSFGTKILVEVHPEIANFLYEEEQDSLLHLEKRLRRQLIIRPNNRFHREEYKIYSL